MDFLVDIVKQGKDTNDGNKARKFSNPQLLADIKQVQIKT